ncbi:LamG domain-containing protein [bacterium]|nr:LamG domain-containing protein [bacterium]NUN45980.1 LamG domain-containing protein [bacterium]
MRFNLFALIIVLVIAMSCDENIHEDTDITDTDSTGNPYSEAVAYYPFHGNTDDASANQHIGTSFGPLLTAGHNDSVNDAYHFDGTDDLITVPDDTAFHFLNGITITAWVYAEEQKTQYILTKGGGLPSPYKLALSGTGDVIFSINNSEVRNTGYSLNQWMHIAGSYDGITMRLYVNGEEVGSLSAANALVIDTSPLFIGTRLGLSGDSFKGSIDEVALFDIGLTAAQLKLIYTN